MRGIVFGLLLSAADLGAASAQVFEGSDGIEFREVYGTINITLTERGPLTVEMSGPGAGALAIRKGQAVSIVGDFDKRTFMQAYRRQARSMRMSRSGVPGRDRPFEEMLKDEPVLTITAAPGTAIRVVDGAVKMNVEGRAGDVEIDDNAMLLVTMGDMDRALIGVHGHGYVKTGDIAGPFEAAVHGSGDLVFGNAGLVDLSVHGSGDVYGKAIAGDLTAQLHGSGDLELGDVAGRTQAQVHGSGDLELGRVAGGIEAQVYGSGDLIFQGVSGNVDAVVHGSGEIDLGDGEVQDLDISVHGSGSVSFDGASVNAKLRNGGSGNITVGPVLGATTAQGRNIRVAGKTVSSKR